MNCKNLNLLKQQSMGIEYSIEQKYKQEKGSEAKGNEFVRWC